MKCKASNHAGKPCGAPAILGTKRCIMHSGRAAELGSKGDRARTLPCIDQTGCVPPPRTVAQLRDLLSQLLVEVRAGRLSPKLANAISYMGSSLLRTMGSGEARQHLEPIGDGTVKQIYKAQWLRDKEAQLADELEKEFSHLITADALRNFIRQFLQQVTG